MQELTKKIGEGAEVGAGPDSALQLQKISTSLIQEGNIDALYEAVLDAAIGLMSADMGSMQVFLPGRKELRLLASRGFHPQFRGVLGIRPRGLRQQLRACNVLGGPLGRAGY